MLFRKTVLASALALMFSANVAASNEFVIEDIKVTGLQRVALGATLTYIPLQANDKVNDFRLAQSIKSLFASGHFEEIEAYRDGNTLIFKIKERPTISEIILDGNDDLKEEQLMDNLDSQDIRVGEPLDKTILSQLEKGLEDFYQSIGKYNADVEAVISYLPRNRVTLTFNFEEGDAAKVKQINIVGNELFSDNVLLSKIESQQNLAWWQLFSKDRYQKQAIQGDMETIESFYKDKGYISFLFSSTQVSLTPNKEHVYVTLNVDEGDKYTLSDVDFVGDLLGKKAYFQSMTPLRKGNLYNASLITQTEESLNQYLGNIGYAFPEINTIPSIDKEKKEVKLTINVEPGNRINVRRVIFEGNNVTDDEVLRRELRQMESSWLSSYALELSKSRMARLPYIESVEFETLRLPGDSDQVDILFTVKEQPSGAFNAGIGYGDYSGLSLQAGIQQTNFLGTGNSLSFNVNTMSYQKMASISYTDPYFTVDGVSLGGSLSYSEVDYSRLGADDYNLVQFKSGLNLGYPIDELNRVNFGIGFLHNELSNVQNPTEQSKAFYNLYTDPQNNDNQLVFDNFELNFSWSRNTLNKGLFPTAGSSQRLSTKITTPNSDVQYYKLNFENKHYVPLDRNHNWVFTTRLRFGYANGYGELDSGNEHVLPTWELFRAGGQSTMRGFENNVVGPKLFYRNPNPVFSGENEFGERDTIYLNAETDILTKYTTGNSRQFARSNGGNAQALGSLELIFPLPFVEAEASTSFRTSAFIDVGNVWDTEFDLNKYADLAPSQLAKIDDYSDPSRLRASAGISFQWISPMGPIVFSFAKPLESYDDDSTKFFTFNVGQTF